MDKPVSQQLPRVLVLSATGLGSRSATGHLMAKLFANWRSKELLSIYTAPPSSSKFKSIAVSFRPGEAEMAKVIRAVEKFDPEVIYYRPVDNPPEFAELSGRILKQLGKPYIIHIMDDWPSRLEMRDGVDSEHMIAELKSHIAGADVCLSICEAMSSEYQQRYGRSFIPIANGVRPDQLGPVQKLEKPFRVLYSGALAEDMTYQSVLDVATAVSNLSHSHDICLDIRTMPWFENAGRAIADRPGVTLKKMASNRRYAKMLNQADCLLIAYNFDDATKLYTQLSLANKLPECLGSGTPVLAYGPPGIATIDTLLDLDAAIVIPQQGVPELELELRKLMENSAHRERLATKAMRIALDKFNIIDIQNRFQTLIGDASMKNNTVSTMSNVDQANVVVAGPHSRESKAHIDETKIVASYSAQSAPGFMIDVGAHHGSAFMPFHKAGWTVHGFEPDPKNRGYLEERYTKLDRFELDSRAVSDVDGNIVPFYVSEESTGISGLSAFRETHEKVCDVETVTLKTYMQSKNIEKVDFLKIDTEGFDLMVLKGFPWDSVQPEFVECEFEDNKTKPLGYEFDDIASFLVDRGYHVFVSEWHPIVRYGIKHQWRGLFKYPGHLQSDQAWGNLLAFKSEPDMDLLKKSIAGNLECEVIEEKQPSGADIPKIAEPKAQLTSPAAKVATNVKQPPVSSNRLVNYIRMFTSFYFSPPGVVLVLSALFVGASIFFFPTIPEPWNYVSLGLGALSLMFVPAYFYARNRFLTSLEIANRTPLPSRQPQSANAASGSALKDVERRMLQAMAEIDEVQAELGEMRDQTASIDELVSDLQSGLLKSESSVANTERSMAALTEDLDHVTQDIPLLVSKYMDLKRQILHLESSIARLKKD